MAQDEAQMIHLQLVFNDHQLRQYAAEQLKDVTLEEAFALHEATFVYVAPPSLVKTEPLSAPSVDSLHSKAPSPQKKAEMEPVEAPPVTPVKTEPSSAPPVEPLISTVPSPQEEAAAPDELFIKQIQVAFPIVVLPEPQPVVDFDLPPPKLVKFKMSDAWNGAALVKPSKPSAEKPSKRKPSTPPIKAPVPIKAAAPIKAVQAPVKAVQAVVPVGFRFEEDSPSASIF